MSVQSSSVTPTSEAGVGPAAQPALHSPLRIAVAICTTGRAQTVAECVVHLAKQKRPADVIWVCGASQDDIALVADSAGVVAIVSEKGVTIQRNRLIDGIGDQADILMFMDDDFLMHETYLARVETLFVENDGLVAVNGVTIADGINTRTGYTFPEAASFLAVAVVPTLSSGARRKIEGVYGCNFAVRQSTVLKHAVRFDERLPLYAWQEDIDFATRLSRHGVVLRVHALGGVHLGVKGGRTSGVRLGYSQVANTAYLALKGTMSPFYALKLIAKNMTANIVGSARNGGPIDRKGRLRGNLIALRDVLLRRRVEPERILEL